MVIGIHTRSLTFTCAQDNHATFHSYPRATDPIHRAVLGIGATTTETITVNYRNICKWNRWST